MIGEDGGLAHQPAAKRHAGRIELRQVHLHHIVRGDQFGCHPAEGRRDDPLADAKQDRDAQDAHPIHDLLARQGGVILRGHHRHLMPALDKGARQPFGIDGQPGGMRAVIGQDCQDLHGFLYFFSNPKQ